MSEEKVRKRINEVQDFMTHYNATDVRYGEGRVITKHFLNKITLLLNDYGAFLGRAKASHPDYIEEISAIANDITTYFEHLTKSSDPDYCFNLVNLAIGKISQLLSFVEELNSQPPEQKVSMRAYEKLERDNEALKKAIEFLGKYRGSPELNELLEKGKSVGLPLNEDWILTLCSSNLIESLVNKKLEELEESKEGNFKKRYHRLAIIIKQKENRDISKLLPIAVYDGIRNKLDHASHKNIVTEKEASQIFRIVVDLIDEIFQ